MTSTPKKARRSFAHAQTETFPHPRGARERHVVYQAVLHIPLSFYLHQQIRVLDFLFFFAPPSPGKNFKNPNSKKSIQIFPSVLFAAAPRWEEKTARGESADLNPSPGSAVMATVGGASLERSRGGEAELVLETPLQIRRSRFSAVRREKN